MTWKMVQLLGENIKIEHKLNSKCFKIPTIPLLSRTE